MSINPRMVDAKRILNSNEIFLVGIFMYAFKEITIVLIIIIKLIIIRYWLICFKRLKDHVNINSAIVFKFFSFTLSLGKTNSLWSFNIKLNRKIIYIN